MNNIVETKEQQNELQVQIEQKKNELTNVLQKTILEQYAYTTNSQSPESFKKRQEVAKFVSQLVATKDTSGRPAILNCTKESIMDCCMTYCNNELNFFKNQAYLYCFGRELKFMTSKDGYVSLAKQMNPEIEDFYYDVVYKGDDFEYSKVAGKTTIIKHVQKIENITCDIADIVCAYATVCYKNGTHEADIMTIKEILNSLKTAHKGSFTDTHKLNPRIMLSKFPLRRLAKKKINQSENKELLNNVIFEDDNNIVQDEQLPTMEITIDETQDFVETIESEVVIDEIQPTNNSNIEINTEDEITVAYSTWINEYKDNGWEQIKGSYDKNAKTVRIKKC